MTGQAELRPERASRCVLVTRPAAQAQAWVEGLRVAGLRAEAFCLLDIRALMRPEDLRQHQQRLADYTAVMLVSGNAVDHFLAGWTAPGPQSVLWLATGPGTVRRLLQSGVPAEQIQAPPADAGQFDSEALWRVIGHRPWAGRRVLLVRGRSGPDGGSMGRQWLAEQLERAGAELSSLVVYQRCSPVFTAADRDRMERSCRDGSIWLFSSSEAIEQLPADLDWSAASALATHPRIAQAARERGFSQVIESRPSLPDVLASIKSQFHD